MRTVVAVLVVLFVAVAVLGCAGTGKSGMPCESCQYKVKPGNPKTQPAKITCVVDGKEVDCRKTPAECPGCRK